MQSFCVYFSFSLPAPFGQSLLLRIISSNFDTSPQKLSAFYIKHYALPSARPLCPPPPQNDVHSRTSLCVFFCIWSRKMKNYIFYILTFFWWHTSRQSSWNYSKQQWMVQWCVSEQICTVWIELLTYLPHFRDFLQHYYMEKGRFAVVLGFPLRFHRALRLLFSGAYAAHVWVIWWRLWLATFVESGWNVMAQGDAPDGNWRGNWRMEWVASTLHTTSDHGVPSITTADAHTSAASSRLKWHPHRFKWNRPFRRNTKSGFCACAITFQTQSTIGYSL